MSVELARERLRSPRLSVVSAEPDPELARLAARITSSVRIEGRPALAQLFGELLRAAAHAPVIAPKTLDLLGHATATTGLLRLGDWVIDSASPAVMAWFRELANHRVLARLGIHAVRLLACRTAGTPHGRATICALAELLGVEVYGTHHLLYDAHHDEHGFCDRWGFLLVAASELRRTTRAPEVVPDREPWPRRLDVDALPAVALGPRPARWPRRIATAAAARELVALIRRDAGAQMPGLRVAPSCELALPSVVPATYHLAEVLLDGGFLRFYPDGVSAPGVAYPVDEPGRLRRLVEQLSLADASD
jgi:hypothetical protein